MARLYTNENFPQPAVARLRELGHDVATSLEDGRADAGIPDRQVLVRAAELSRVVVTLNKRDFESLHQELRDHCGIVVCTTNLDHAQLADQIDLAISEHSDLTRQIVRVYRPG